MTPNLACPLLGLFGADDRNPSPEMVAQIEAALKANGKDYEFHTYEGAATRSSPSTAPTSTSPPSIDGWQQIWDFFGKHLA